MPLGVVDAGERAGEEFELDAAGLEFGGQRHQFGGVAGQALELVDSEDDRCLGRSFFELVGQRERFLQCGPDSDSGADLLVKDPVALRPSEGLELARQLLVSGRCPGVTDPNGPFGRWGGDDERWAWGPGSAGPTVGGHRYVQFLAQCGYQDEAWGVVFRGGLAALGPADASGGCATVGAAVTFYRGGGLLGVNSMDEVSQKCLAQWAGFERSFANDGLGKHGRFVASRRTLVPDRL